LITTASISIFFPYSTAGVYSIVDSGTGRDSFSVQLNTNGFTTNCPMGSNNCVAGDTGWVQFTYQADPGPSFNPFGWGGGASALCIWNVDVTKQNYNNACTGIPAPFGGNSWAPGAVFEILGGEFKQNVFVIGCWPWASSSVQCNSVVTPDTLGLCWNPASQCAWQQVSGSLLGLGNGSAATFPPGVTMVTSIAAASCVPPPSYVNPFHPFPLPGLGISPSGFSSIFCPAPGAVDYNTGPVLNAFGTFETNNLTPDVSPASSNIMACFEGTCWFSYAASD
jgi:hypothetical protein